MCLLATSEFSHEAVKKHQETVVTALKVNYDYVSARPISLMLNANLYSYFLSPTQQSLLREL